VAITEVRAFNDFAKAPPDTLTKDGWTVSLGEIKDLGDGKHAWPFTISQAGSNSASGLNSAAILIPDCNSPAPPINVFIGDAANRSWDDFFAVGQGDPQGFGESNQSARVVQGQSDNLTDWTLVADTNQRGTSTIKLRVKGKVAEVNFEMATPGCRLPNFVPTAAPVSTFKLGDRKICFDNDPLGCKTRVFLCPTDPDCAATNPGPEGCNIPPVDVKFDPQTGDPLNAFVDCNTFDFDGLCPSVCGVQISSDNCQIISLGGVPYGPICF
jgi:hypothetical protein